MQNSFDILVVGGGHAGAEAAHAAARLGCHVGLITMSRETIGQMSCNPAIGGLAKGQLVREVDALGGLMGRVIDATGIQFRMLNRKKGPAVWGPRAQADKWLYKAEVRRLLEETPGLTIIEDTVQELRVENGRATGVLGGSGQPYCARAVILTTGTFMKGLMHTGEEKTSGGRVGEGAAETISDSLRRHGLTLERLKTGTPPRLDADSIDFDRLEAQPGDTEPIPFSFLTDAIDRPQINCWITHTNDDTHDCILANLHRAPMYSGQIEGTGPRYCPSIEDKVVRFAEKQRHQIFLEPEGLQSNSIYCNGISTSLPADTQDALVHSIPGLEQARFLRYGYAVEYDYIPPMQTRATMESKIVPGLFIAGQINGTSGYEEASGQGLMAGINAACQVLGRDPLVLGRDQAYIGVMIDDLVTKGLDEPYRMFTSRAEHRLLLRTDNADERLTPLGKKIGLVDDARWDRFQQTQADLRQIAQWLGQEKVDGKRLSDRILQDAWQEEEILASMQNPIKPYDNTSLLRRTINDLRYAGYVAREKRLIEKMRKTEHLPLPQQFDYHQIPQLRFEARERLNQFQPLSLGQAGRISGINPADVSVLMIYLEQQRRAHS